ncbi:hypothetical protein N7520_004130 [Penicillium odoratum]|uniref:uncharacterized protein n=1 Tax=Penicillium odoratum TaxID=1167516 RepID=UPI002549BFE2|nr:uncharacterized protein N7520_004130 [Penicillium odoratum]KAJ5769571.1 hypothetical protein N7520_004130 [Penicillium odoratum]
MSKPALSLWIVRLLGAWITCSGMLNNDSQHAAGCTKAQLGALAGDCGSVNITSVSSADALRKNCQIVDGDVVIGPFSENSEIYNINLDGVEIIKGSLRSYDDYGLVSWPFAVSSTTLKEVQRSVGFPYLTSINLTSLSLPSLTTVGNTFDLVGSITSLNIKSLESVPTITLGTPYLRSIQHAKLTNVSSLWIEGNYLDSLDSFFNNAIDINSSVASGPFPNIDTITVGFTSGDVSITSKSGVILGGPTTMAMAFGYVYLAGGAMFLNRSSTLKSLTAKSFDLGGTSNTLLDIPFDDLTNLYINLDNEDDVLVEEIRLPPIAVNWTDFNLYIFEVPSLNLSSQYSINDNGFVFQTWYWPESVSSIYIRGAIVANPFLCVFLLPAGILFPGTWELIWNFIASNSCPTSSQQL